MAVTDTDYAATWDVTDVIDSTTVLRRSEALMQDGVSQKALYDLLNTIITNFNGILAKLDADGGVTDTDYVANCAYTVIGSAGHALDANGIKQDVLVTLLTELETNFEIMTAQLDSDAGVADTNYAATWDFDMDTTLIKSTGIRSQGDVLTYLDGVIAAIAGINAKLDADSA